MRYSSSFSCCLWLCLFMATGLLLPQSVLGIDLESFEFNDSSGTILSNANNTANSGNQWTEDTGGMAPSDVRGGVYNVVNMSTSLASNYLDIANVTSGTVYLTAEMDSWDFRGFDANELEEFRFGFLNEDTGNSGNTITAEFRIRRNSSEDIILSARALGNDGTSVPNTQVLSTVQSNPFEVTLALDKTANTYEVFYKDNNAPTQVLGSGLVDPDRDANSLRLAVNNVFGDGSFDYPVFIEEFFAVDRLAVSDTNPYSDLISLEVNRQTGAMTLQNNSGAAVNNIESYSITSALGGLDPSGWSPIGGSTQSSSTDELMEDFTSAINLTNTQTIPLGSSAWLRSPFEDVQMVLNLTGGGTRTVDVNFTQNGGERYAIGDLNLMGGLTAEDYLILNGNAESTLSPSLSFVQQYLLGNLDGDDVISTLDFVLFKELYEAEFGPNSFASIFSQIPEPSSLCLILLGSLTACVRRRSS